MTIKAVLFDLDGTLIDSLPLIMYASRLTHEKMGLPYDEDYQRSTIGLPIVHTAAEVAGERSDEYLDVYADLCNRHQKELINLYPNILDMLDSLQKRGLKIAVVTARRRASTESIFDGLGLRSYIIESICAEDTVKHKPEPEPALLALNHLGVSPENAVMVGDSSYDIGCGNAAGCTTAAVAWGVADEETLKRANPKEMFHDAKALSKWLLEQ